MLVDRRDVPVEKDFKRQDDGQCGFVEGMSFKTALVPLFLEDVAATTVGTLKVGDVQIEEEELGVVDLAHGAGEG